MIKISFDITPIINDYKLSKSDTDGLMKEVLFSISENLIYNWKEEANNKLNSTRDLYNRGIQLTDISERHVIVSLIGTLPNMLENGTTAFDMKKGFSNSKSKKNKKDGGWYLNIPFRFATSNALGESPAFSNKMPEEVHKAAKKLPAYGSGIPGGGLKTKGMSKSITTPLIRKEIKTKEGFVYGAYKHKSNIYEGMTKQVQTYNKATQSKYISFRRVSDSSDPLSWMHKGFTALNLAEAAVRNLDSNKLDTIIINTVDRFL